MKSSPMVICVVVYSLVQVWCVGVITGFISHSIGR